MTTNTLKIRDGHVPLQFPTNGDKFKLQISELSSTVLSQCNSYLLHRFSNDRDQEPVLWPCPIAWWPCCATCPHCFAAMPFFLAGRWSCRGWWYMNALPEHHRPKSTDPNFWPVSSNQGSDGNAVERKVDWKPIADDWQQATLPNQEQDLEINNVGRKFN